MQGYIKLYRKTMSSPIWHDPHYLKLWMYCLMKASYKEHEQIVGSQLVKLNPGEFVTGRKALAMELNMGVKPEYQLSERTWYRYLENLQTWQMLTIKKTNKFSVISILKWHDYQEVDQQMTNNWPSTDHHLATNKKGNKGNKDKKKDTRHKRVYDTDSIPYKLAAYLFTQIRNNMPEFREPDLQAWSDEMRKIVELDKRDHKQAAKLIKWAQASDFWWRNILSAAKFRKQYDTLLAQSKADSKPKQPAPPQDRRAQLADEQRKREIALNKWIEEGNDPDDFKWH